MSAQSEAYERENQRKDFLELKRLIKDYGIDIIYEWSLEADMELYDEADETDDDAHNDPRHGQAAEINRRE